MKKFVIFWFFMLSMVSISGGQEVYYPDGHLTPGATMNVTKDQLCVHGYTAAVRDVPIQKKRQAFALYHIPYSNHSQYEVDHLISLELGGSNDIKNLWPQKYCPKETAKKSCFGAREKDVVETNLHKRICTGQITIKQAQHIIVTDWYAEYIKIKGK
jgi:hypothetical protein